LSRDVSIYATQNGRDERGPGAKAMGSPEDVRAALLTTAAGMDWSDPAWGQIDRETFSIDINPQDENPCTSLTLHVHGNKDDAAEVFSAG